MIITPELASSSPARMLRMVDLPQPEWPTMQTNSPFSMEKCTWSKTANGAAPRSDGDNFDKPSTRRNSTAHSTVFRVGDSARQPRQQLVEQHADQADQQ